MKEKRVMMVLALVIVCLFLLWNPGSLKAAEWPKERVEWKIIAGAEKSFGYIATTILAKVLTDSIENFTAYSEAGGTIKAFRQMAKGKAMMTYGNTASLEQAYLDRGPFEKQPLRGMKPQMALPIVPFTFFMVSKKETGIRTMDDLVGKDITITTPTYGIYTPAFEVMKAIGLWDKVRVKDVSFADYAGAISGNIVDSAMAYIVSDSTTSGAIRNVEARINMTALTFTEEQKTKIGGLSGIGFRETKNIFSEVKRDRIGGWSYYYGWCFSPKANERLVYQIVKTCYEKREELAKASVGFIPWKAEPK
jgi:TRAP transporter TAXI family solute receptor